MKRQLYILTLFFHGFLYSQNQTIHWNFGNKAGLDFNNDTANVLTDSEMDTQAGSSSISDKEGKLLFYTNGHTVWNSNHNIMENGEGLSGEIENTQTSIIIPKPGSDELFYIFNTRINPTTTSPLLTQGVYRAEVEISTRYPLGKVLTRSIPLIGSSTGRITAVHHKNGKAIWLITFGEVSGSTDGIKNTFNSYKIDENGLSTPIRSLQQETISSNGAMKASPNGKLIAIADSGDQRIYVYNFNNETGAITENINIFTDTGLGAPKTPYGIAFSRDSKILYYSGLVGNTGSINQYTLENPFPEDPTFSLKKELYASSGTQFGSLQLANDSKIYVALFEQETNSISGMQKLGVVNFPENIGLDSQYTHNFLDLLGGESQKGLPNFIQSYFASRIRSENNCVGALFSFTAESYADIQNIQWDFGDGTIGNGLTATHRYSSAGTFVVKATIELDGSSVIVYKKSIVYPMPNLVSNQELTQCDTDNDGLSNFNLFTIGEKISENHQNETFFFYKNQDDMELDEQISNPEDFNNTVPNQVIYTRVINENGCEQRGSFLIKAEFVTLGSISTMYTCEDSDGIVGNIEGTFNLHLKETAIKNELALPETSLFSFHPTFEDAKLKNNEFSKTINSESKIIWVRVDDPFLGCNGIQSFELMVNATPIINLEEQYTICYNMETNPPIIISGERTNDKHEWLSASNIILSTQQDFRITAPGIYKYIAYKTQNGITCSNTKKFKVKVKESPIFEEFVLNSESLNITLGISIAGNSNYLFSLDNNTFFGNGNEYCFENVNPGIVTVYVKDINNCEPPIQKEISVIGFPKFFSPNNDGYNDLWSVKGANSTFFKNIEIVIFNRYGIVLHRITRANTKGWNGTYNGITMPSGEYWYQANLEDLNGKTIYKTGSFSLLRR